MTKLLPEVGFWDPLSLSADGDVEVFKRRREVELKRLGFRVAGMEGACFFRMCSRVA